MDCGCCVTVRRLRGDGSVILPRKKEKKIMMYFVPMSAGFSYIDPAITSYLIQIGVGVVIAAGTAIGVYRSKIKRALKRKQDEETAPAAVRPAEREKDEVMAADLLDDND